MLFVLSLPLYGGVGGGLLTSCRTKSQCINIASVDSLSIHQKDSVGTKMEFSFDRMIITYLDQFTNPTLDQFTNPTLDQQSSTVTPSRPNGREGHGVRGSSSRPKGREGNGVRGSSSRPNGREGNGVRGSGSSILLIENGHLATASNSKSSTDTDLKSAKVEKKQVHIRSQPNRWYIVLFVFLCIFFFFIYKKCSSR